jgi:peptide/nickel transport system substrate-binding protein
MRNFLIYFFVALTLVSCSKSNYEDKNILVVAIDSAPRTLDPRYTTDANGQRMAGLLFQSLVRIGQNLDIEGEAAKNWKYKDLTYTFELVENLKFSNGEPVTPKDILFSFDEYRKADSPFKSSLEVIESVQVDEKKVILKLKRYSATFLTDLIPVKILPESIVTTYKKDFSKHLVGSGYYFLKEEDINLYKFAKNIHFPDSPVKTDSLYIKVIQDDSTRYLKLRKGELDIAQNVISPIRIKDFLNNPKFRVITYPGLSMSYLLINLKDPKLKNKELRKALAKAINTKDIIQYKMENLAAPATSILSPNNPFYNQDILPVQFDLETAKQILKNIEPFELQLKTSNSLDVIENAKILANQISKTNIHVTLQSYEWGTFYNDIKTGNFQLAMMRWVGATDPDIYRIALHSSELPPGRNRGSYVNKDLDLLLERGLVTSDITERKRIYDQVQNIVNEDMPYIPLWYNHQVAISNARVVDYEPRSNGDFLGFVKAYKTSTKGK